jgi:hypothetical protein
MFVHVSEIMSSVPDPKTMFGVAAAAGVVLCLSRKAFGAMFPSASEGKDEQTATIDDVLSYAGPVQLCPHVDEVLFFPSDIPVDAHEFECPTDFLYRSGRWDEQVFNIG